MKKSLVAVFDSEGGLLRSGKIYGLYDISFAIIGYCRFNPKTDNISHFNAFKDFSFVSWTSNPNIPKTEIKLIKRKIWGPLGYYMDKYECDSLILSAWGCHHDKRVLKPVVSDRVSDIYYLDLLKLAKKIDKREIGKYSLQSLLKRYSKNNITQTHTAFGDTLHTIQILKCLLVEQGKKGKLPRLDLLNLDKYMTELFSRKEVRECIIKEKENAKVDKGLSATPFCLSPCSSSYALLPTLVALQKKKYDYLWSEKKIYRIRKGWMKAEERNYKNFGLYYLAKSKDFVLIRNQKEKLKILEQAYTILYDEL